MIGRAGGLGPYVPTVASSWDVHAAGERWRAVKGSLVFVDISGFTNLSERLAQRGRIGAEELTGVLDRVFGRMLEIVSERGGSLLKFGGDALLLLFDTEDGLMQACAATVEMRRALRGASEESTSVGRINLKMSAGIHTGLIDFFLVGDSHRELIVSGPAASMTTAMESTADAGEIVVSEDVRRALPPDFVSSRKGQGWILRKRRINHPPAVDSVARNGHPQTGLADFVPRALRSHLEANIGDSEHRIATVGFVKFKGVDALLRKENPQRTGDELHRLVATIQAATDAEDVTFLASDIDADGGKIILSTGVPSSHHDDEGRMLRAARAILDKEQRLSVQIGVNRGHVFCGDVGTHFRRTYTVMGDTVNLAARLMATARPGELYATSPALNFASTVFRTDALEPFHVKGKSQPVLAFTVGEEIGVRPPALSSDLPFRGRDAELQMLVGVVNTCSRVGRGGIMTVTGEPGIGKSRLIAEVLQHCSGMDSMVIQSDPSGIDNPYWAFRDPLRRLLGVERSSQKAMARQLTESVLKAAPGLERALPLFGDVAQVEIEDNDVTSAIDSRFRPDRTADALIELLSAVHSRPIAIIAEDGQWLDEASLGLLSRLGQAAADRPWTVLVTARTGDSDFGVMGDEVVLGPLSDTFIRAIAVEVTQATPLRPHELDEIVAKTDGNPLFLSEILRMISETGRVDELPDSLDAVVSKEIDVLPPLPRQLLRYSSVLGRRFRQAVLEEFLAPEGVLLDNATMRELGRFVEEGDDGRFTFRHSVVHDIAYRSLSYSKRRQLHGRAGDVIARQAGDPESVAEYLSTHYSQSGEYEKAWRYAQIAADKARKAYANAEAAAHLHRALDAARHLKHVPSSEVADLWTRLGEVRELSGQLEAAREAYSKALKEDRSDAKRVVELNLLRAGVWMSAGDLAQAKRYITLGRKKLLADDRPRFSNLMARLDAFESSVHVLQRNPDAALALATSVINRASELGDKDEALARAYQVLDWANFVLGNDEPRRSPEAIEIYQSLGQLERSVGIMNNLGAYAYWEGNWDSASDWYRESIETAARSGNVAEAALGQANLAEVLLGQRRYEEASPLIEEAERTFRSSNAPFYLPFVELLRARLLLGIEQTDTAVEILRSLLRDQLEKTRTSWTAETGVTLADAHNRADHPEEALKTLQLLERELAEDIVDLEPAVGRVGAEALAMQGHSSAAIDALDRALEVATKRGDPYQEMMIREARIDVSRRVGVAADPTEVSLLHDLTNRLGVVRPRGDQQDSAISR